jgi:hypothetical protein
MSEPEQAKNTSKANSEKSTNFEQGVNLTTLLGKVILAIGATSYVLGILVVNLYLGKFGAITMSLVKVNYLLTGVLTLMPLLCWAVIIMIAVLLLSGEGISKESKGKAYLGRKLLWMLYVMIFIFAIWALFKALKVRYHVEITLIEGIGHVLMALATAFFIVMLMIQLATIIKIPNIIIKGSSNVFLRIHSKGFIVAYIFGFIVSFLVYIIYFTENIYPKIPSYLGGAKPVSVQVFVDPNSEINISFGNCKLTKKGQGVWEGKLILATEDEYLFAVKDANEALCIRKQDVKAIKYYQESLFGGGKPPSGNTSNMFFSAPH